MHTHWDVQSQFRKRTPGIIKQLPPSVQADPRRLKIKLPDHLLPARSCQSKQWMYGRELMTIWNASGQKGFNLVLWSAWMKWQLWLIWHSSPDLSCKWSNGCWVVWARSGAELIAHRKNRRAESQRLWGTSWGIFTKCRWTDCLGQGYDALISLKECVWHLAASPQHAPTRQTTLLTRWPEEGDRK